MTKAEISQHGHRERMRTLVKEKGLDALTPHQLVEFLLFLAIPRKDTKKIAYALLNKFGSFDGILNAPESELKSVCGMTENAVVLCKHMTDFFGYYQRIKLQERPILSAQEILPYLLTIFDKETDECLYMLCLDIKHRLVHTDMVACGNGVSVQGQTKKIVEIAMRHSAKNIILAHNHPSEIASPSSDDIKTTLALGTLLQSLDIKLMDHVILGNHYAYSFYLKSRLVVGGIPKNTYPMIAIKKQ